MKSIIKRIALVVALACGLAACAGSPLTAEQCKVFKNLDKQATC